MDIRLYGRYYYRDEYYKPHPITVVEEGKTPSVFKVVDGHWYKHQIFDRKLPTYYIPRNKIIE